MRAAAEVEKTLVFLLLIMPLIHHLASTTSAIIIFESSNGLRISRSAYGDPRGDFATHKHPFPHYHSQICPYIYIGTNLSQYRCRDKIRAKIVNQLPLKNWEIVEMINYAYYSPFKIARK